MNKSFIIAKKLSYDYFIKEKINNNYIVLNNEIIQNDSEFFVRKQELLSKNKKMEWLKYFVGTNFYNNIINFTNITKISKTENKIYFTIFDKSNNLYIIKSHLTYNIINDNTEINIYMNSFDSSYKNIPNFIKNRVLKTISEQLEEIIKKESLNYD